MIHSSDFLEKFPRIDGITEIFNWYPLLKDQTIFGLVKDLILFSISSIKSKFPETSLEDDRLVPNFSVHKIDSLISFGLLDNPK